MIRELRGESTAFVLDTPHTTLALLTLPTGQIETVYYGNRIRIDSAEDALALSEKNEFPSCCSWTIPSYVHLQIPSQSDSHNLSDILRQDLQT